MFLPVDVPRMTPSAVRRLGEACRQAAVPGSEPLPAAYARSALPVLESRLAGGDLALRAALRELAVAQVELDLSLLVNMNTPGELRRLG